MTNDAAVMVVREVVALNDAWKSLQDLLGPTDPSTLLLRDMKSILQARLLRDGHAHLEEDTEGQTDLWSVRLPSRLGGRSDACHLPKSVAERLLTEEELEHYVGNAR